MNKVALVNESSAGGIIFGPGSVSVYINSKPVSLDGDYITPHGSGQHTNATITASNNTTVFVENKKVVVNGDLATCGDSVSSTSSVTIG